MFNHTTISKCVGVTITALYFSLMVNTPIFGQDQDNYFGIGFGISTIDIDTTGADQVNDSSTAIKFLFGSRNPDNNTAFEVAFADLGKASIHYTFAGVGEETDRFKARALSIAFLGFGKSSSEFSFFGKIGFAYWMVDASADAVIFGTPISGSGSGFGLEPVFGFGVNMVTDNSMIRISFERYLNVGKGVTVTFPGLGSVDLDGADVDVIGVTLIFKQ